MQPRPASSQRIEREFRLREWMVQPTRNRLVSQVAERHLEPRTMDVLVVLASQAGEVVTKEAIIDAVWQGRIIAEGTLTNAVAELRQALGDDSRTPSFVETIPKRGYRLVAPVEAIDAGATGADAVHRRRRRAAAAVLAGVVALTAAVILLRPTGPALDTATVLIVPFANRTGDASLDAVGQLIADRLSQKLTDAALARAVPAPPAGGAPTLEEVCELARRTGAGLAVTGATYLHEGRVEAQAQLIDVSHRAVLYAVPPVLADRGDLSPMLDALPERLLGALASHLLAHAHSRLQSHVPPFDAYREFLAGSELFAVDAQAAIQHLSRATEIDPAFTSAQLRLAVACINSGRPADGEAELGRLAARRQELTEFERLWLDWGLARLPPRPEAGLAALRRIRLAIPDDPMVTSLIAQEALRANRPAEVRAVCRELDLTRVPAALLHNPVFVAFHRACACADHIAGDFAAELAVTATALADHPDDLRLVADRARALAALGDGITLERVLNEAAAVSPARGSATDAMLAAAAAARAHGHHRLASATADRVVETLRGLPPAPGTRAQLAAALVFAGDLDAAQEVLQAQLPELPEPDGLPALAARGYLGMVAARRGDLATAAAMDAELAASPTPYLFGETAFYRASVAAWLGHREKALSLLRQALAEGWCSFSALHDRQRILFEPLEDEPTYRAILAPAS